MEERRTSESKLEELETERIRRSERERENGRKRNEARECWKAGADQYFISSLVG